MNSTRTHALFRASQIRTTAWVRHICSSDCADKAIENYSRARAIDPTFDSARNGEALGLAMLGRYEEAIAANPGLVAERTILLSRVGRYREAAQAIVAGGRQSTDLGNDAFGDATLSVLAAMLSLERRDAARAAREAASAERVFETADHPRRPTYMVLTQLVAGLAAIQNGNMRTHARDSAGNNNSTGSLWPGRLVAQGTGRRDRAGHGRCTSRRGGFLKGRTRTEILSLRPRRHHVIINHLPSRDGLARAAKARGDLAGAIAFHRRLLTSDTDSKWVSALEPRYVLELARLLEKTGERGAH